MNNVNNDSRDNDYSSLISRLIQLSTALVIVVVVQIIYILFFTESKLPAIVEKWKTVEKVIYPKDSSSIINEKFWSPPIFENLSDSKKIKQIQYGKDLIVNTAKYFGEKGIVKTNKINGMNCQNCHLEAGTKIFGNNYSAVWANYPKYRARSGGIENIYKRVNDCFERSLNGHALDTTSKEMKAIVAYIEFVGSNVKKGKKPCGAGLKDIDLLNRAANPSKGKMVFESKCASCHQKDGLGMKDKELGTYIYPPLWGNNSYNTSAGLYRISNFAKFVKYNMPLGVNHQNTQLSNEEAWDVAAFVNSQPRPKKLFPQDWPKLKEKAFDHPFGPYVDGFSEQQHKYGPFQPIIAKLDSLKKLK